MIELYSGTPGSGKSYSALLRILRHVRKGIVVANFVVNVPRRFQENFIYLDNEKLTVNRLIEISMSKGLYGREGRGLLVIDEAQIIFNSRESMRSERMEWIKFFSQSRKLGYDVILIAQFDRMLDRQIRSLVEYEVKHINMRNYFWLSWIPVRLHCKVTRWYGEKMKLTMDFFVVRKKYYKLYDSYKMFDVGLNVDGKKEAPRLGGTDGGSPAVEKSSSWFLEGVKNLKEIVAKIRNYDFGERIMGPTGY